MSSSTNKRQKADGSISLFAKVREAAAEGIVLVGFAIIIVYFSSATAGFLTWDNLRDILLRAAITGPISLGIMLALIVKGIDLSPGATVGLAGLAVVLTIEAGLMTLPAFGLGILVGIVVGAINGTLVSRASMNPFIVTLSMMFVGSSIERVVTRGGLPVYLYGPSTPEAFVAVYRGSFLGIRIPFIILGLVVAAYYVFLERTKYGRRLYASGASIKGANTAGIRVRNYYGAIYVISGISAAIGGIVVASQVRSAQPLVGQSFLWDAIGAAFLSTLLSQRARPNTLGTLFGVLLLATFSNGLTLLGLEFYWKEFFRGALILAILLTSVMKRKYGREAA